MIELTDITLRESGGHYLDTCNLMDSEIPGNDWMLRSNILVSADILVSTFVADFYFDGRVVIAEAMRPIGPKVPYDDLRDLNEWCIAYGWKRLEINDQLLTEVRHFQYWMQMYQSGVIYNKKLEERDNSMISQLQSYKRDADELEEL